MIKKLIILILIICLITPSLISCRKDQDDGVDDVLRDFILSSDHIDAYAYLAHRTELQDVRLFERVSVQVHDGRIYYCYTEFVEKESTEDGSDDDINRSRPVIMLASITVHGDDFRFVELGESDGLNVLTFNISGDGIITVFALEPVISAVSVDYILIRIEYDLNGRELKRDRYTDFLPEILNTRDILQTMILDSEHIAILIRNEQNNILHILNISIGSTAELKLKTQHFNSKSMVTFEGGGLLVLDEEKDADTGEVTAVLRELNFHTGDFGDVYHFYGSILSSIFPVYEDLPYDFLIADNSFLYGYSMTAGEQMKILNWQETGIVHSQGIADIYVGAYSDGSFLVMNRTWSAGAREIMFYTLSPVSRDEMPEQTALTLGGMMISDEIRSAVIDFNRENRLYRIEIIDYFELVGGNRYGHNDPSIHQAGFERFSADLLAGKGPDIIIDNLRWSDTDLYMDLYPFIDADNDLDRSAFIPSVLPGLEKADGTLPVIATTFSISTMVGTTETVGHIISWTPSAMLKLAEESNLEYPFDINISRWSFIWGQLWVGSAFIDWETFTAKIDSDAFISILESSKHFPEGRSSLWEIVSIERHLRLLRGESLVLREIFPSFRDYHFFTEVIGDDMIILGEPTSDGGKHFLAMGLPIGINASSQNADGAWEFLRTQLLSVVSGEDSTGITQYFPVLVSLFEEMISEAATPRYETNTDGSIKTDDDGIPVEIPHFVEMRSTHTASNDAGVFDLDAVIEVFAMSDSAASQLRNVVYTSTPYKIRFSETLSDMLSTDIDFYLEGARTAEDTARLMQNRVQRYLSEQELILGVR